LVFEQTFFHSTKKGLTVIASPNYFDLNGNRNQNQGTSSEEANNINNILNNPTPDNINQQAQPSPNADKICQQVKGEQDQEIKDLLQKLVSDKNKKRDTLPPRERANTRSKAQDQVFDDFEKYIKEFRFFGYYVKHPLDAFYEAKVRKHVSLKTAFMYAFGLIVLYMMHLVFTGMLFSPVIIERTVFIEELFKILVPFVTFVLANYLVSSLMEGEGSLRAIFTNTLGSLIPVYFILPIMIFLSNVLTYNEQFIYQFGFTIMIGWTAVLMFFNVKDTHNYTVKETIYNFILTVVMMIVMIIVIIMVYMMIGQVVEFISNLFKEVIINA
jgi:hypothetical protein